MSALAGIEHRRLATSAGEMAYLDAGEGGPVFLLHGSTSTSQLWEGLIPALAPRFRVIAPDLLGTGGSERRTGPAPDLEMQSTSVRELVAHLGIGSFAAVGHDLGGAIAQLLAVGDLDVAAIVLIGSLPVGDEARERGLASLETPALILWGEDDDIVPAWVGERLHEAMPSSSLALLPGCGHDVLEEAAATVPTLIAEWLRVRYLREPHSHADEGPIRISLGSRPPPEHEFFGERFDDEDENDEEEQEDA